MQKLESAIVDHSGTVQNCEQAEHNFINSVRYYGVNNGGVGLGKIVVPI